MSRCTKHRGARRGFVLCRHIVDGGAGQKFEGGAWLCRSGDVALLFCAKHHLEAEGGLTPEAMFHSGKVVWACEECVQERLGIPFPPNDGHIWLGGPRPEELGSGAGAAG